MNAHRCSYYLVAVILLPALLLQAPTLAAGPDVPYRVAQLSASATHDIPIKRGTTHDEIGDVIWVTAFTSGGEVVDPPLVDDPIAESIDPNGEFRYGYALGLWNHPALVDWVPTVNYRWKIKKSYATSGGFHEQSGWVNEFDVQVPEAVGHYTLEVELRIYRDDCLLRKEKRKHTLYVLLEPPATDKVDGVLTTVPKAAWLEVATRWARGESTPTGVLSALNQSVYENPFGWSYGAGSSPKDGTALIERESDTGICSFFREAWRLLALSLGIEVGRLPYDPSSVRAFLTSTRPALDQNHSANALNVATGKRDRWRFSNHELGRYEDVAAGTWRFYDPTFGLEGTYVDTGTPSDAEPFLKGNVYAEVPQQPDAPYYAANLLHGEWPIQVWVWPAGSIPGWTLHAYQAGPSEVVELRLTLLALLPTGDAETDRRFEKAIRRIEKGVALELWTDFYHLRPEGKKVFDEWKKSIKELMKVVVRGGPHAPAAQGAIDELIAVLAFLARDTIDHAEAACGGGETCQMKIDRAEKEMDKAALDVTAGKYCKAAGRYAKAWCHAQSALPHP